jgi:drug/metabolite transporter (DMT)-like permease
MQECRPDLSETAIAGAEDLDSAAAAQEVKGAALEAAPLATGSYLKGVAWALFAVSIWGAWFISTKLDVTSGLTAYDLVALRFGVSGLILLPLAIKLRGGIGLLSWQAALAMFAGSGAIYSLCSTSGVAFAPAAEGAALTPGVMPMATALLSVLILKERLTKSQIIGFCFIFSGAILIAGLGLFKGAHLTWIGHLLFVTGAFLFAAYTIALRRARLSGLEAIAVVSLWSCIFYLPIYSFALHPRLLEVPATSLLVPAIYQGVLTNVVSLVAYARAVAILGPSKAAPFAALIPASTAIGGTFILGEYPAPADWVGIVCVSAGVYLASGAPLPWRPNSGNKSS